MALFFVQLLIGLMAGLGPSAASAAEVSLAWDPSPDADIAGYRLYHGTPVGNFGPFIDCGNVTNFTVVNLMAGRTYGFYVTSYNRDGLESEPSNQIEYAAPGTNAIPVASAQTVDVFEGLTRQIQLAGSDPEGDALKFAVVVGPTNGVLSGTPPALTYRSRIGFFGPDSFTYVARNKTSQSAEAKVTIQVKPQLGVARLKRDANEDGVIFLLLPTFGPTGTLLNHVVTLPPLYGKLEGTQGTMLYRPPPDFNGTDELVVTSSENTPASSMTLIQILVRPVNDRPNANAQEVSLDAGLPHPIRLSGRDIDGDALSFNILQRPTNGTLSGTPPDVVYSPNTGFTGKDSFTFQARDGSLASLPATISLNVQPVVPSPFLDAGPDQVVTLPSQARLRARILNSTGAPSLALAVAWNQTKGPVSAVIEDPFSLNTRVTFTEPGLYSFLAFADDGEFASADSLLVNVHALPAPPPARPPFVLYLEAEAGRLTAPMEISTNPGEGPFAPLAVRTPIGGSGALDLPFEVPVKADYLVWCRILRGAPTHNSFKVTLDEDLLTIDIADLGEVEIQSSWTWVLLTGRGGAGFDERYAYSFNPKVFHLAPGAHQLTLQGREADTHLDVVAITNDPDFDPRLAERADHVPVLSFEPAPDRSSLSLSWQSIPGRRYVVLYKDELSDSQWIPASPPIRAVSTTATSVIPSLDFTPRRFYGVISLP